MGHANEQRILRIKSIEELLKKRLPMDRDKTISLIMYEIGVTKEKAREYVKVIFDMERIDYNKETTMLQWKKEDGEELDGIKTT